MDTSETYIKMMGKAWPILKPDIEITHLLFSRRLRMLYVLDGKVVHWRKSINTENVDRAFPLLEQDQLQEIVDMPLRDLVYGLMYATDRYGGTTGGEVWGEFNEYYQQFTSMEQLWLAFVMKERNKVWDGEKWT